MATNVIVEGTAAIVTRSAHAAPLTKVDAASPMTNVTRAIATEHPISKRMGQTSS
ncbi:MAG: hypothetical protein WCJ35_09950 [Planctomycetota bacterium]